LRIAHKFTRLNDFRGLTAPLRNFFSFSNNSDAAMPGECVSARGGDVERDFRRPR
jgi:hypothetical protein